MVTSLCIGIALPMSLPVYSLSVYLWFCWCVPVTEGRRVQRLMRLKYVLNKERLFWAKTAVYIALNPRANDFSIPDCPLMTGVILSHTAMSGFILSKHHIKELSSLSHVWNAGYSQGYTSETVFCVFLMYGNVVRNCLKLLPFLLQTSH